MAQPFYTIGHSTRSVEEFIRLLTEAGVTLVADVRTIPRSRTNPQFNQDTLPQSLASRGIAYKHIAELGGRRGKQPEVDPAENAFWTNQSFHNYADYASTDAFRAGLARLGALGHEQRCAIMCAEAVWWRCHRRIIADYLISAGEDVLHILGPDHVVPAARTSAATMRPDGILIYPAAAAAEPAR